MAHSCVKLAEYRVFPQQISWLRHCSLYSLKSSIVGPYYNYTRDHPTCVTLLVGNDICYGCHILFHCNSVHVMKFPLYNYNPRWVTAVFYCEFSLSLSLYLSLSHTHTHTPFLILGDDGALRNDLSHSISCLTFSTDPKTCLNLQQHTKHSLLQGLPHWLTYEGRCHC